MRRLRRRRSCRFGGCVVHLLRELVHGIDERFHKGWVLLAGEALAKVSDEVLLAKVLEHLLDLGTDRFRGTLLEELRVEVALEGDAAANGGFALLGFKTGDLRLAVRLRVKSNHIVPRLLQAAVSILGAPGEDHEGNVWVALLELGGDVLQVLHLELVEVRLRDVRTHSLEHLQKVSSLFDLLGHVFDDHIAKFGEEQVAGFWVLLKPLLSHRLVVAGVASNHVEHEGERGCGEANQRHIAVLFLQRGLDFWESGEDVRKTVLHQLRGVGSVKFLDIRRSLERVRDHDALASRHLNLDVQGLGHDENVGEQNGGIDVVTTERLHGHLCDVLRVVEKLEEVFAGVLLVLVVFRKVATSLSEEPHRGPFRLFSTSSAQKKVVSWGLSVCGKSLPSSLDV
mmetsp:Transcript_23847/g.46747  ORF Transcript_23847/g.46747 Transcript_23847/m.46747 type:complete len:397 (-) Transcript_23847:261-1451(-)